MSKNIKMPKVAGCKLVVTKKIPLIELHNEIDSNRARAGGKDPKHINALKNHIQEYGMIECYPTIAVRELKQDEKMKLGKNYFIVDGNHRHEALLAQDTIHSVMVDVYSFDSPEAMHNFQVACNTAHPPCKPVRITDVVSTLLGDINAKVFPNIKKCIKTATKSIYPNAAQKVHNEIVAKTMADAGTQHHFIAWSDTDITDFLADKYNAVTCGNWDEGAQMYGFHVKEESEWRVWDKIMERYVIDGMFRPSYVHIAVLEKGLENTSVNAKREKVIAAFMKKADDILTAVGLDEWPNGFPFEIRGCLPQDKTLINGIPREDINKIVPVHGAVGNTPNNKKFVLGSQ